MVGVGGAVALSTVVRIVKVELGFVATESVVLGTVDRRVVVDAGDDGLPISGLDEERRQRPGRGRAPRIGSTAAVGPDAVRLLRREIGVKSRVRRDRPPRHHVADLRKKLVPALVRKDYPGRAALDRPSSRNRILELQVGG